LAVNAIPEIDSESITSLLDSCMSCNKAFLNLFGKSAEPTAANISLVIENPRR